MWSTWGLRQPEARTRSLSPNKRPRFIPAQPRWVISSPGLSSDLNAPADGRGIFVSQHAPCPQQKLIFALTQSGTSGKFQSKRIFNAVDMLVQIAD